ncbi:receptor-like cytosolic serine/threonine-protein kinase RBK1 isoform X2 [Carex rostrata]
MASQRETVEDKTLDFSSTEKGKMEKENIEPDHDEGNTSSIGTDLNAGIEKLIGSESPSKEEKQEDSGSVEASPKRPLDITIMSSTSSDADTDLDAVSSIDQAIDSHDSGREAKQEASGPFEASPKEPLVITIISSTNSDADTDLDSVSSIDQAINSDNSAKQEDSGSMEASPKGPLEMTIISGTHSDADTDLDAVSSIDQAINSHKSVKEEDQSSEPDPDESSYQSSPHAVLETTGSSISTDSDTSGIEWQSLNHNENEANPKQDANATLDTSISTADSDTANAEQLLISRPKTARDASGQWKNLISGLMLRKKKPKSKSMVRAETFPPTTPKNLKWCLERMKNVRVEKMAAIMPEEKFRPSWRSFDYQELVDATDGFNEENLLGKGGHAEVYKGRLPDGQLVAVKRLTNGKNEETRMGDFLSELGIIAHVNHPNAAQLLGFSAEGGLLMVLKFSPHGSLASLLHGSKEGLDWKIRYNIAVGIAEGLLYLHEGCHRRIIHRDIKASNILLTGDYQPQISDFGLAKWLPDEWPHHIVFPIEGTFGYLAPEYFMHGVINEKTDVFAYGVILLELITGRRAVDSSRQSLVIWAKPLLDQNKVKDLVDPSLENAYDMKEMVRLLMVASMCIHHTSTVRPRMNSVVRLLKGEEESVELTREKWKPKVTRPPIVDACDADDYTSSRYLNDLNRYKQLALE